MELNEILDENLDFGNSRSEPIELLSDNKFALLCFFSFGIYPLWWMYVSWKFFAKKDNLDIYPAVRAILALFFLYPLLERIKKYSILHDYPKGINSGLIFIVFLVLNFLSEIPDPYWMISLLTFVPLMSAFRALNFAIENSNEYDVQVRSGFSGGQLAVLIIGILFFTLVMLTMFFSFQENYY